MSIICSFFAIDIFIHYNDHNPPHFHAKHDGKGIVVDIKTGKILRGSLHKRAERMVNEWWTHNRQELLEDWELAKQNKQLKKLKPLQ